MTNVAAMKMDMGVGKENREKVAEALKPALADTFTLYLKTLNYHWNVRGPMFQPLHGMFEEQYTDLAEAADDLAEHIRILGFSTPGSYKSFSKITHIKEADDSVQTRAKDMIANLQADHETVIKTLRNALRAAEKVEDDGTADLLAGRMRVHEKTAWMLRSFNAE